MKKNQKIRTQWAWKFEMVVKIKKEMTPVSAAAERGLMGWAVKH